MKQRSVEVTIKNQYVFVIHNKTKQKMNKFKLSKQNIFLDKARLLH